MALLLMAMSTYWSLVDETDGKNQITVAAQ